MSTTNLRRIQNTKIGPNKFKKMVIALTPNVLTQALLWMFLFTIISFQNSSDNYIRLPEPFTTTSVKRFGRRKTLRHKTPNKQASKKNVKILFEVKYKLTYRYQLITTVRYPIKALSFLTLILRTFAISISDHFSRTFVYYIIFRIIFQEN